MPFAWYHPDLPPEFAHAGKKAMAMYEEELRSRAMLLLQLGFSKEETKLRLRGNVNWDFELNGRPGHYHRIDAIVDKVYSAQGAGAGGPPSL
jgi:hypothetical protein